MHDEATPQAPPARSGPAAARPPTPPRRPQVLEAHGDRRVDDYYWLHDREDPEVLAHLHAERAYADAVLAPLLALRDELFAEIRSHVVETDVTVPVRHGPWWYYRRTEEGRAYPIHCRRRFTGGDPPTDLEASLDEQVLLDENALAEGHEFFRVGLLDVSPGHGRLACATDTTGDERYALWFRALDDAAPEATEVISDVYYGSAWSSDDSTFFYTRVDDAMRPHQVWRHRLGDDPASDALVLQEDDQRFTVTVGRSKDGDVVLIGCESTTTSEWWFVPADRPDAAARQVLVRRAEVEYSVEHHRGCFVVLSNEGAEDFKVGAAPGSGGGEHGSLIEVVTHRPGARIESVDVLSDWLVLEERADAEPVVRVIRIPPGGVADMAGTDPIAASRTVASADHPSATWEGPNPEPGARFLRVEQTSLVRPRTVYDVDLVSGDLVLRRQDPVRSYDMARYRTAREWAVAPDGTRVPISLVHREDVSLPAPCLLYGYGSYEACIDPAFSARRLPLLDRGVVYAIAHVRGGGELGRRWYVEGKLSAKRNTVSDFLACARHLVGSGIAAPGRLAARGASAGGLLMGAIVNEAPELFAAVVAEVPFVDCLTTMLDESIPLTVGEFEEWGDPIRDAGAYADIKAYSPYDNVGPGPHPSIFATGGLHDTRVGFWEPAKWVAKLRAADPGSNVVFRPELTAGHGGRSGRYEAWRDEALVMAWLLDALGAGGAPG